MINVLFVCLGNICRSPMAEAVFKHLVAQAGLSDRFRIDSAGTSSYHVGDPAHYGTRRILSTFGIRCDSISRQITGQDLAEADYILAMDRHNLSELRALSRRRPLNGHLHLLLEFAEQAHGLDVPDPYYTDNFDKVYHLVEDGCRGLLRHIRAERGF